MNHICEICNESFDSCYDAVECFFSHEDHMNYFLPDLSDVDKICDALIEKHGHKKQIDDTMIHLDRLKSLLSTWNKGCLNDDKIKTEIANCIIMVTQMAYLFSSPEDMDKEIRKTLDRLQGDI